MTAFYMFRAVFLTFGGEYRGGDPEAHGHPHESPMVMVLPMVVLAVLAVVSGFWNMGGDFSTLMGEHHAHAPGFFGILGQGLPWLSLILAGLGILLAYAMYSKQWISPERIGGMFKPFYTLFLRKYYLDELYENIIVKNTLIGGLFKVFEKTDTNGVDGIVNGVAGSAMTGSNTIRNVQTGQLQLYGMFIGIGIVVIILAVYIFG